MIIDLDATLVTAHSEKEHAAPTFKRGYGFHPLCAFVDHGPTGTGEPLHLLLRPGNAGSNTAADHIAVTRKALAQVPGYRPGTRPGRKVLIRTDAAGATHAFLDWLTERRLSYSIGFTLGDISDAAHHDPRRGVDPGLHRRRRIRDGAWVAELTGLLDLTGWPAGMRVIARKERPHPGAQLRLTDVDGHRITAFATNTRRWPAARPGVAASSPGPRRGPDPQRQGHRLDQPAVARLRPEPDLVRPGRPRRRTDRLDATARLHRPRGDAGGSPSGSATGSSPSPPNSPAPADASCSTSPPEHPGPT